ncbi:MAG: FAD binding domain-containing protein [Flavobacteriales bacterium]|nr:FAD binding domain-containing protein [Flavobacteriales bacterium]
MKLEIISPVTTPELLSALGELQGQSFRMAAGCTDLLPELRKIGSTFPVLLNLASVTDENFSGILCDDDAIYIGGRATAHQIMCHVEIQKKFPVLSESATQLASTQIRQVATVGGNLCTASPSGDISCALMALEAEIELLSAAGTKRVVPIRSFFTGVRRTAMQPDELVYRVILKRSRLQPALSTFVKVGTRRSMECSVVSLSAHIATDANGVILSSGIAVGASAPTIVFCSAASDIISGKALEEFTPELCAKVATAIIEPTAPITDLRASAWYRKQALYNISEAVFADL